MSAKNVEIVRRGLEAAIHRPKPDWVTMNELYHPVRDAKIVRSEAYPSREEALKAAGLAG
jgi:hypothetical protein